MSGIVSGRFYQADNILDSLTDISAVIQKHWRYFVLKELTVSEQQGWEMYSYSLFVCSLALRDF